MPEQLESATALWATWTMATEGTATMSRRVMTYTICPPNDYDSQEVVVKELLTQLGNIAAILGILLCTVSALVRVAGYFYLGGFELMSLFVGGMGLMVGACLAKLHVLGMSASPG